MTIHVTFLGISLLLSSILRLSFAYTPRWQHVARRRFSDSTAAPKSEFTIEPRLFLLSNDVEQRTQITQPTKLYAASGILLNGEVGALYEKTTPEEERDNTKVGVLFLNLGGPTTGEDVEGERNRLVSV